MLTAQEAKERSTRAIDIQKTLEFNKGIALIERAIESSICKGRYKCIISVKITDNLYTKDEKKLFQEKIEQTIASFGYKITLDRETEGSGNTFFYDYIISWEKI